MNNPSKKNIYTEKDKELGVEIIPKKKEQDKTDDDEINEDETDDDEINEDETDDDEINEDDLYKVTPDEDETEKDKELGVEIIPKKKEPDEDKTDDDEINELKKSSDLNINYNKIIEEDIKNIKTFYEKLKKYNIAYNKKKSTFLKKKCKGTTQI